MQILFLNLVTDVFPALALGVCEGERQIMEKRPRKRSEPILTNRHWWLIISYGLLLTLSVFSIYLLAHFYWQYEEYKVITISFVTLALAQLFHVFNMRDDSSVLFRNDVVMNKYVWGALLLCLALIAMAMWLPGISDVLKLVPLDLGQWLWVLVFALLPTLLIQLWMLANSAGKQREATATAKAEAS